MKHLLLLLVTLLEVTVLQAQAPVPERVVAEVRYMQDGTPAGNIILTDSIRYIYGNSRHSFFNYNSNFDGFHYVDVGNPNTITKGLTVDFLTMEGTPNNIDSSVYP